MASKNHTHLFFVKYSEEFPFMTSSHTGKYAFCKICRQNFKINHGGRTDIVKHVSTDKHKKNINLENAILDARKAMMLAMFMKSDDMQTTKAEVSLSCSFSLYIDQIIFADQNA